MRPFKTWSSATDSHFSERCIVAFDLDDTLTTRGELPADVHAWLERVQSQRIRTVLVTGRSAGWADALIKLLPFDAVVAENGAMLFYWAKLKSFRAPREEARKIFWTPQGYGSAPPPQIAAQREKATKLILQKFPHARVASDQPYRIYDLAIDFAEEVDPPLSLEEAARIQKYFERDEIGAIAKVSSIHVNGWWGDFTKEQGLRVLVEDIWKLSLEKNVIYVGDSPNDGPLFAVAGVSVGVANIQHFRGKVDFSLPDYVTEQESSGGALEVLKSLAETLLLILLFLGGAWLPASAIPTAIAAGTIPSFREEAPPENLPMPKTPQEKVAEDASLPLVIQITRASPVFKEPSAKSRLLADVEPHTAVILREVSPQGHWVKVEDEDGELGWVPLNRTNYYQVLKSHPKNPLGGRGGGGNEEKEDDWDEPLDKKKFGDAEEEGSEPKNFFFLTSIKPGVRGWGASLSFLWAMGLGEEKSSRKIGLEIGGYKSWVERLDTGSLTFPIRLRLLAQGADSPLVSGPDLGVSYQLKSKSMGPIVGYALGALPLRKEGILTLARLNYEFGMYAGWNLELEIGWIF